MSAQPAGAKEDHNTALTTTTTCKLTAAEIADWIHTRAQHRIRGEWQEADQIKQLLADNAGIELMDKDDPLVTTWRMIPSRAIVPRIVEWILLATTTTSTREKSSTRQEQTTLSSQCIQIPLIINTVDTSYYLKRYKVTRAYLDAWNREENAFRLETCHLLDLQAHKSVGAKGILMKGWRTVLIPWLWREYHGLNFVLVAEDDVRFPDQVKPHRLRTLCEQVFASHPDLHILSLGHSWSELYQQKSRQQQQHEGSNLFHFLRRKAVSGIHATTLLALRFPDGVSALQQALETSKPQHLDQYLFHSTHHDLRVALSDPPLAGWADVEQSLTKSGSGHRRKGGGRLARLPCEPWSTVHWIQRRTRNLTEPDTLSSF